MSVSLSPFSIPTLPHNQRSRAFMRQQPRYAFQPSRSIMFPCFTLAKRDPTKCHLLQLLTWLVCWDGHLSGPALTYIWPQSLHCVDSPWLRSWSSIQGARTILRNRIVESDMACSISEDFLVSGRAINMTDSRLNLRWHFVYRYELFRSRSQDSWESSVHLLSW
jgi:hypothetical protein